MPTAIYQGTINIPVVRTGLTTPGPMDVGSFDVGSWANLPQLTNAGRPCFATNSYVQMFPRQGLIPLLNQVSFVNSVSPTGPAFSVSPQVNATVFGGQLFLMMDESSLCQNIWSLSQAMPSAPGTTTFTNLPLVFQTTASSLPSCGTGGVAVVSNCVASKSKSLVYLGTISPSGSTVYLVQQGTNQVYSFANGAAVQTGGLVQILPVLLTDTNYMLYNNGGVNVLGVWQFGTTSTLNVLSANQPVAFDGFISGFNANSIAGICQFGWLFHSLITAGDFALVSPDFTKYWVLHVTGATGGDGFSTPPPQFDSFGNLYIPDAANLPPHNLYMALGVSLPLKSIFTKNIFPAQGNVAGSPGPGPGGGDPYYYPISTIVVPVSESFDIVFDQSNLLSAGETITSQTWTSNTAGLSIVLNQTSGNLCQCRLLNSSMPPGTSTSVICQAVTSYGRQILSTALVVSDFGI